MASSEILSNYSASRHYITLTFKSSIQVSTLSTDDFTFETIEASPQVIPFKNINLEDDYNSIRRQLVLYFAELPPYSGDYHLTISGLRSASGYDYATETLTVPYSFDNAPFDEPEAPDNFVEIEDHSIKEDVFEPGAGSSVSAVTDFYVSGADPANGDIFIERDYNNGVAAIEFSTMPDSSYINSDYIKVQRKQLSLMMSRWETLEANYELDAVDPIVYIKFPSLDATPVYDVSGHDYFEDGYKYRIRLLASIQSEETATPSSESLGAAQEIVFATDATPLYVDPSEFIDYYSDLTLVEALELVHIRSVEVKKFFDGNDDDLPFIAYEYIRAAVHCALARRYDYSVGGGQESLTLGDLKISRQAPQSGRINRGNAGTPCELAAILRDELVRIGGARMRSVVTGSNYKNPMPKRHLKNAERWN